VSPPTPIRGVRPVGDRGFLVELPGNREVHLLAAAVRDHFGARIEDVVPGAETLLLAWTDRPPSAAELTAELGGLDLTAPDEPDADPVTIPVRYDGDDLEAVADAVGVDVDRVIELHAGPEYLVAFMGFAPGFAYMTGGSPELELPRRDEPRPRVPAGSVAIANRYSAVYPTPSPGGWHLLGHTDVVLFDADRDPPALLEPGARVVFEPLSR
jgi:KipI family sensor histidine kinase inhibitor